MSKTIFMTGVSGLIGRWTAVRLTADGHKVIALLRNGEARAPMLSSWVAGHGGDPERLEFVEGDLAEDDLGLSLQDRQRLMQANAIYHLGARMDWGVDVEAFHRVNVRATEHLLAMSREMPGFERFVHISGYLITAAAFWRQIGFDREKLVTDKRAARKAFVAMTKHATTYEISKIEADILVRRARRDGVPTVIVNPSTVIGASGTGEAHQMFGLEGLIDGVGAGTLPAVPGKPGDWLPLVPVDYLAALLARGPWLDWAAGTDFTVLHNGSPDLKRLIGIIAEELGRKAPSSYVPVWVLRPLLKAGLERRSGLPAKALAFINDYRFDTSAAERAAVETGLALPDIEDALRLSIRHVMNRRSAEAA